MDSCSLFLLVEVDIKCPVSLRALYSLIDIITIASSSEVLGTIKTSEDLLTSSKYFLIFPLSWVKSEIICFQFIFFSLSFFRRMDSDKV